MPITFPNSPSTGDTHTTSNGLQYTYDGEKWTTIGTNSAGTWTRTGTTVSLTTATDDLNANTATFSGAVNFDDNVIVKGDGTNGSGELTLNCENNSHGIKIKGPPHSAGATYTLTLPNNTGTNGQVLTTNGSGVSSWSTVDLASRLPLTGGTLTGGLTGTTANFSSNVGVGTASPLRLLDINNSTHATLALTSGNAGQSSIFFADTDTNIGQIAYTHSDNAMYFRVNDAERLRIDSAGNVGIGETSVSANLVVKQSGSAFTAQSQTVALFQRSSTTGHSAKIAIVGGTGGTSEINFGDTSDEDTGIISYYHPDNSMRFTTNTGERLRIDSAGNLNVGTTGVNNNFRLNVKAPSGNGGIAFVPATDGATVPVIRMLNAAVSANVAEIGTVSGSHFYISTGATERLRIDSSGALIINSSSTTGAFNVLRGKHPENEFNRSEVRFGCENNSTGVGFLAFATGSNTASERMRIDSSGRVGIGQSSAAANLHVKSGANDGNAVLRVEGSTSNNLDFSFDATGADINVTSGDPLMFSIAGTERMRITSSGATKSSTDGTYYTGNNTIHEIRVNNANNWIALITNKNATAPHGVSIRYDNSAPNNTSSDVLHFVDTAATRFQLRSNGGIANFQSNDANLCDEREKKNIVSLDTKWDKVKSWELKKFHYNEDADTDDKRYGVIAQQVEEHSPEVLTDWVKQRAEDAVLDKDDNVVTPAVPEILRKGVKEQQMMWMAIKALQEAQARIETLEIKVAALEAGN